MFIRGSYLVCKSKHCAVPCCVIRRKAVLPAVQVQEALHALRVFTVSRAIRTKKLDHSCHMIMAAFVMGIKWRTNICRNGVESARRNHQRTAGLRLLVIPV